MDQKPERQQLVDEILNDLAKILRCIGEHIPQLLLSILPETKKKRLVHDLLYSPVAVGAAVAAVVGALATYSTARWQSTSAILQHNETRRIELQDRKQKVFVEFADGFVGSIMLAQAFKLREAWIKAQERNEAKKETYLDGRGYNETDQEIQRLKSEFMKGKMPDSLCNQVASAFHSPKVLAIIESLRSNCDTFIESFNANEISKLFDKINADYKALLKEMATELREGTL